MAEKPTLQLTDTQQRFIEDMAYLWEKSGGQRMTGRILGWLLIADPPYQSAAQIAEALSASKGSISTGLRSLVDLGLLQRTSVAPRRIDHYRAAPGMWLETARRSTPTIRAMIDLGTRGLAVLGDDAEAERRAPLEEMVAFYTYTMTEMAAALDRWQADRDRRPGGDPR
jgi:DNA-binding transcriptional regulator GbsR (MarR family)